MASTRAYHRPSAQGGVLEMLAEDKPSPTWAATMKEEGEWSSEKRPPHGSTKFDGRSIIPDWASLPPELVEKIADHVLSTTGGADAYMDMRAVCHSWHFAIPSWRSAIAKVSSPLADLRFRPRNWVMLDLKSKNHDGDACLFLHVPTGRFRRRRLPLLRDHTVLGASDGLIVLGLRDVLNPDAHVLNPLTGHMLHFAELFCDEFGAADEFRTAVSGGPNPTLVVWRDREWMWRSVLYADPTSAKFMEEEETGILFITTMVTFQGNIYLAGSEKSVMQFVRPAEQCDHELVVIAQISPDFDIHLDSPSSYLVESAGELLLVRHKYQALKVFRVDVEHKLLEGGQELGLPRLFLGGERCLSVDANMLPSVNTDCIYLSDWVEISEWRGSYMHVYNLRDGTMEILSGEPMLHAKIYPQSGSPWYNSREIFTTANNHCLPPLSLIQVLLDYCNDLTQF